ncbi:hypothetical protein D8674_019912 [Pyrus ussuriensis x Pyrus communis]|uniref:Uncharacterized protein n=1 Tax=Pyrus ussuriensis x Pyrus communis TaxID=2448454 RepID=A0A5N5GEH9_9ROSA|nr:hypothetical protein D8674_019912 [Pyrus ussuriensis x Pyrus communis]
MWSRPFWRTSDMQSSWSYRSASSSTSSSTEVLSSLMANKLFRCSVVISSMKKSVTAIVGGGGSCETMPNTRCKLGRSSLSPAHGSKQGKSLNHCTPNSHSNM